MGVLTSCDCVARSTRIRVGDTSLHPVIPSLAAGTRTVGVDSVSHARGVRHTTLAAVVVTGFYTNAGSDAFDAGFAAYALC